MTQVRPIHDLRRFAYHGAMPPWFHKSGSCHSYVMSMRPLQIKRIVKVAARQAVELHACGKKNAANVALELAATALELSR